MTVRVRSSLVCSSGDLYAGNGLSALEILEADDLTDLKMFFMEMPERCRANNDMEERLLMLDPRESLYIQS